jgi:hypothetical protein
LAYFLMLGVIALWAGNFPAGKFALAFIGPYN